MFDLTPEEVQAFVYEAELAKAFTDLRQQVGNGRIPFGTPLDDVEKVRQDLDKAREAMNEAEEALIAFRNTKPYGTYILKTTLNKALAEKLPGGALEVYLAIFDEAVDKLKGPEVLQAAGSIKKIILTLLEAATDEDIQLAYARVTFARYCALCKAGFTASMADSIVIAEASRPWPQFRGK